MSQLISGERANRCHRRTGRSERRSQLEKVTQAGWRVRCEMLDGLGCWSDALNKVSSARRSEPLRRPLWEKPRRGHRERQQLIIGSKDSILGLHSMVLIRLSNLENSFLSSRVLTFYLATSLLGSNVDQKAFMDVHLINPSGSISISHRAFVYGFPRLPDPYRRRSSHIAAAAAAAAAAAEGSNELEPVRPEQLVAR